jgi:hypothetical protein
MVSKGKAYKRNVLRSLYVSVIAWLYVIAVNIHLSVITVNIHR